MRPIKLFGLCIYLHLNEEYLCNRKNISCMYCVLCIDILYLFYKSTER